MLFGIAIAYCKQIYVMKKLLQISAFALILSILAVSCSSSKTTVATHSDLKGNWEVTSTEVQGTSNNNLKVVAFDDVALSCFNGSQWTLPNNGYGSYNINSANCAGGNRPILWSQREKNGLTFLNFKKMDGVKKKDSKRVEEGYSLEVTNYEKDHFTARSPIDFEGRTIYIVYHFSRR